MKEPKTLLEEISEKIGMNLSEHIEEFSAAFMAKNPGIDPRKVVMVQHTDYATGKMYTWFEKKKGRSRKDILTNAK